MVTKIEIQNFEKKLDEKLESLPSLKFNGSECIKLALFTIEAVYLERRPDHASNLKNGFDILLPYFMKNKEISCRERIDLKVVYDDLLFACDYYMLREYLYYSYNSPNSIDWEMNGIRVELRFNDLSIPRQFYMIANNDYLVSEKLYNLNNKKELTARSLLSKTKEFQSGSLVKQALKIIMQIVNNKLNMYYDFLSEEDLKEIDLGPYTMYDMREVYRTFLFKAYYHRFYSEINNNPIPIHLETEGLVKTFKQDGFDEVKIREIIQDISYDSTEILEPLYFSLYYLEDKGNWVMGPFTYCLSEIYMSSLRIIAQRKPEVFQKEISPKLTINFTNHVESLFLKQGFFCKKDIKLNKFDSALPDIDLLVVSEEPTLGYVIYFCELKNPIPPMWSKDHLKALNKDSVSKSFEQLEKIRKFIVSEEGVAFLKSILIENFNLKKDFDNNFVMLISNLVITSRNAGMFFSEENTTVIDYITLERILENSDGDMAYIMKMTKEFSNVDEHYSIENRKVKIGDIEVVYPSVALSSIIKFPKNQWKTGGYADSVIKDYFEEIDSES